MPDPISRRVAVKSSIFGLLTASLPSITFAKTMTGVTEKPEVLFYRYPAIPDDIVSETVGASHFNIERVKELVNGRPELARATWDWSFGDFESAIGAASHVGRRDIVDFLLSKGARADIFTFAMMGSYDIVKSMIEFSPGIQRTAGPHGISLLQHVKIALRSDTMPGKDKPGANKLLTYLESLGDADGLDTFIDVKEADQQKFLGDYRYGDGPADGFSVKVNMRKLLSLGRLGKFGGALYQKRENVFMYNGAPSVEISFSIEGDRVTGLSIKEPDLVLTAKKV